MSNETPIQGLSPDSICADCQQAALDDHASNDQSIWSMNFTFCEHTSRSLVLKGPPGKPSNFMISVPAPYFQLKAMYDRYQDKMARGAEQALAEAELSASAGETRH